MTEPSNAWRIAMEAAARLVSAMSDQWWNRPMGDDITASDLTDLAKRISALPSPPDFRAAVEAETREVVEMLREATAAWEAALALDENTSPFGGEIMRDRTERTMERTKASVAKSRALLTRIDGADSN